MPWPFWAVGAVLLLVLLAGWWFDRTRRREGRGQYEVRGNKQQMVGVPVAGEMIEKPPERRVDHSSAVGEPDEDDAEA
ncbi:MAG TPA: hypothetical protein VK838_01450 [Candidatus Limnocylindrales bacterium]|nr:hypothetical protein [Candidatus Limnocylindrales bacterium]